eukprot:GHRR01005916.1.p1 GENE.GHRR01005916.1~~GHRR01005916.1.p1  ORF type:complete len:275 (+),score=108.70 GHRR01005916.1:394-1218(+)
MDYEAEQAMELEALEAIFPDDLEEFEGNLPDGWTKHGKAYSININPSAEVVEDGDADEEPELQMQLVFAHTPSYPDEPPSIRLRSIQGLSDGDLQEATGELQRHIEESLGMAMIYNLVTAAQEWLAARIASGPSAAGVVDPEAEEKRRREEEEQQRAAARAHGTPVTIEAFNAWRKQFEAEQQAKLGDSSGSKGDGVQGVRLTGKQWFLQQAAAGRDEAASGSEGAEENEDSDGAGETYQGGLDEDEDEDIDFNDDDDDDEQFLEEYLDNKTGN